ncbi:heavy metal-associated isoprenylated plant protein 3-like isoform X1 [Prosopis cineraria]|uniref:heavy metal-associated isoprenylated plant protein 3-like isoform X1 n=1 Tax=Prosopis cineraria TaxID=364024 RepID=UPI00240F9AE2|nr:heavy metal-associated isoprenylated plant protein 3-like isoform X1 [Prosopis cineraria]
MGEKKTQKSDAQTKDKNHAPNKGETSPTTVVLEVDLHCDGCASRIIRFLNCFQVKFHIVVKGVETVKVDGDSGRVTITGNVDPSKLRDKLADKTKKKVDLISPQPKKGGKDCKTDKKKPDDKSEKKNADGKQSKEPQQSTAVLKMAFHCQGCIERIRKTVSKTKGVKELSMDKDKETITVKGSMDVKSLVESLNARLKRKVEVVPPKKDKEKDKEKEKDGAGEKGGGGKGGGKKKGGGDNKKAEEETGGGDGAGKLEQSKMEFMFPPYAYGYNYGPVYYMEPVHPPQMFSDENPNACSLM